MDGRNPALGPFLEVLPVDSDIAAEAAHDRAVAQGDRAPDEARRYLRQVGGLFNGDEKRLAVGICHEFSLSMDMPTLQATPVHLP